MRRSPKITVLLCTARPDAAYLNHPDWHVLGTVLEDLEAQTFEDFELIVVDGLCGGRAKGIDDFGATFTRQWVPPRRDYWVANKRIAIATYRNTGLEYARGELVVNIDDCFRLPPKFLEAYWTAWHNHGVCLAACWPQHGDIRVEGIVATIYQDGEQRPNPPIYGFGSYPLEAALELNGYDEIYNGSRALEDVDWSVRLHQLGIEQALLAFPGFESHAQSRLDFRAVDETTTVVCCNRVWNVARKIRFTTLANVADAYEPHHENLLYGTPCPLLGTGGDSDIHKGHTCAHHLHAVPCAYPDLAQQGHPLLRSRPAGTPVFDLRDRNASSHEED